MPVDVHSHLIPEAVLAWLPRLGVQVDAGRVRLSGGHSFPVEPEFVEPEAKLAAARRMGFDGVVVSIPASVFLYEAAAEDATAYCRVANQAMGGIDRGGGGRSLRAMGILPLQDAAASVRELERAVERDGLRAFAVGPEVPFDVLAAAERLDALLFLHPYYEGPRPGLERHYSVNVVGNPLQTSLGAYELVASGTLARLPRLRLLLAHGGGFLPYLFGRVARAAAVRPEVSAGADALALLRRLFYDTMVYLPETVRFLVAAAGATQLVCGSDHPFDMGDPDPVGTVRACGLAAADQAAVLDGNARRLFDL